MENKSEKKVLDSSYTLSDISYTQPYHSGIAAAAATIRSYVHNIEKSKKPEKALWEVKTILSWPHWH